MPAFVALAAVAITCSESTTGPRSSSSGSALRARISVVPQFSPSAARAYTALVAASIDITSIHVLLTAADGSTRDTVVNFPVGQDSIQIAIDVPATNSGQPFTALFELRSADGTVLFSGTQVVTALPANQPNLNPPKVTLSYSGPGKFTKTVTVGPSDTSATGSPTLTFTATAVDSAGKPVPNLLVSWTSSDATVATVTSTGSATASVRALGKRGVATISASTPLSVTGSTKLSVVPAATHLVVISGDGQTAVAGSALPVPFVVEAQAADNLPVPGTSLTFRAVTTGGSVAQSAPVLADAAGRGSMVLTLGTTGNTYQYEAAAPTLTPVTVNETATPAPAVALTLVSGDGQTDSTLITLPQSLRVKATDRFGGPAAGAMVNWTRVAGSGSVGTASTQTANDGTTSTTYTLGTQVGAEVVSAELANVIGAAGTVHFVERAINRGAATLSITSGVAQSGPANTVLQIPLVARATDVNGGPVPGQLVTWTSSLNGATFNPTSGTTSANGTVSTIATLGTAIGANTISATSRTLIATTTATVTIGLPALMSLSTGNGQTATVGTAVGIAPSVVVKDAKGTPVPNVSVVFAVGSGGGNAAGLNATTNAQGIAAVGSWTLGTIAGPNTLTATAGQLSATFVATGAPGAGSQLAFGTALSPIAASGVTLSPQPVLQLEDAHGNAVASAGVVITASIANGTGSLTNAAATTVSNGTATFSGLTLSGTAGPFTLSFSAPGYTPRASGTITLSAGAASTLALVAGDGQAAAVGTAVTIPPSVLVTDAAGNPVSGTVVTFAAVTSGGIVQNASTSGTSVPVTTNASGIAALNAFLVGSVAQTYALTASAGALTGSPATFTETAVAGPVAQLAFQTSPSSTAQSRVPLGAQPVVSLLDALGNVVPTSGVLVTAAIQAGNGILANITATTVAGVATFSNLTIAGTAGQFVLSFTALQLPALTPSVTLSAGAPAVLSFATSPTSASAGSPITPSILVDVQDADGNTVTTANRSVSVVITPGTGTANAVLSGATTVQAVNGVATFSGLSISLAGTAYSMTGTSAGLTSAVSAAFNVTGVPPTLTTVTPSLIDAVFATVPVTLGGANFVLGGTTLSATGGNITVSNVVVQNSTTLTSNFIIRGGAPTSTANVTATTTAGTSGAFSFALYAVGSAPLQLGPANGGGGGNPYSLDCAPGMIATGLNVRGGGNVDQVQVICQAVTGVNRTFGTPTFTATAGGSGGSPATLSCPASFVLTGLTGRIGSGGSGLNDAIAGICSPVGGGATVTTSSVGGNFQGSIGYSTSCPAGLAITGIQGGAGNLVDRTQIKCK